MSTASFAARRSGRASTEEPRGFLGFWAAVVAGLLAVAFLVAWLLGWVRFTTDPRVREVLALQAEAQQKFAANGGPQTVQEATEAFDAMGRVREKIEGLPPHLQAQVRTGQGDLFRSSFRQRIDDYFNATGADRQKVLDRQIDQEEMFRKAMAGRGGPPGGRGGPPGPPGGGPREGQGGGRGGGPPQGGDQDARNRWFKGIIDGTTPEQRARFAEHRRAMDQRRKERGLEPGWPR